MNKISRKNLIIFLLLFSLAVNAHMAVRFWLPADPTTADTLSFDEQQATVQSIKKAIPSVASIIVYDRQDVSRVNLSTGERTTVNERKEKGEGTGIIISPDGLILTNKHVISSAQEKSAEYRIILNNGKEYYAQLIGKDPVSDLAVLKIFDKNLPAIELGDSDKLNLGDTVIAIGNALGRYQNSVTKGIVSGLGRSIVASDGQGGNAEALDNVIQTDAEINPGNSGGPLISLEGKLVGINTAIDDSGSSLGFALPVNDARQAIDSVRKSGRIIRPRLGVLHIMLTTETAKDNNLPRSTGAWIIEGDDGTSAVQSGSPAEAAGLEKGDIVFEINGIKLEGKNTLRSVMQKYKPGQKIGLKIQRGAKIIIRTVVLDQMK